MIAARIQRRAATLQPEAQRRLLAAFEQIRSVLNERELLRAYNSGQLDRLLDELLSDSTLNDAFRPLKNLIDRSAIEGGATWDTRVAFDTLNQRVIDAVRRLDTRVIQTLKDEVRETVRTAVQEGIEAGKGPRVIATRITDSVGLAPNQEQWVANFRRQLETGDRSALRRMLGKYHAAGKGLADRDLMLLDRVLGKGQLKPEQIDRMVTAYRKRLVAWNTETHARTIALDTQRLAQRLSWQSAIDNGTVDANRLVRKWIAVLDSRTRDEHRELHGTEVGWHGLYPNGENVPGESTYNCRCVERIILKPAYKAAA
jgi:hypothetical protein